MDTRTATMRQVSVRAIGWLAIALLAVAALIGPAVPTSLAAEGGGEADCPAGTTKIVTVTYNAEADTFNPATVTGFEFEVIDTADGPALQITNNTTSAVWVVVKGGPDQAGGEAVLVAPGDTEIVEAPFNDGSGENFGVSNFSICAPNVTTTTTTEQTTSATTTVQTTTETTTAATTTETTTAATTTGGVSSTTSANTTTASSGGVSGTTTMTLPPTSTVGPDSGSNSGLISFGLLLLALGGLVVTLASPMRRANNR
jgi:hypothetical protein